MKTVLQIIVTFFTVVAFLLVACAPQTPATPTEIAKPTDTQPPAPPTATEKVVEEPIPVGVISNLTGPETASGTDMVRGVELAVEQINNSGGINGRMIKLIVEDAEYRPEKGVEAAHKLIDVNKVPVILDVGGSGQMLPVGEYAQTQGVVLINTGASSPKLRNIKTLCSAT